MVVSDRGTTIRVKRSTKDKLHSLDFIRKDSDNSIIECLIDIYKSHSKKDEDMVNELIRVRRERTQELKEKLRRMKKL